MDEGTFSVTVYPHGSPESIEFTDIDKISLVNADTYGPLPVFAQEHDFNGVVLYVNPDNIDAMEVSR